MLYFSKKSRKDNEILSEVELLDSFFAWTQMLSIGIESEEQTVQRPSLSSWKPFEQTQVYPLSFETQSVFISFEQENGWLKTQYKVTVTSLPEVDRSCCYYIFDAID